MYVRYAGSHLKNSAGEAKLETIMEGQPCLITESVTWINRSFRG